MSHIRSGDPTAVHILSLYLILYFNQSKVLSLSTIGDYSYSPSKLYSRKTLMCTRMVPSTIPSMDHSGTPNDAPSIIPSSSQSLE